MRRLFRATALLAVMVTLHGDACAQSNILADIDFLGLEDLAQKAKMTVFAVQIEGNQKNESKSDDWISLGTGFFFGGKGNVMFGMTCKHIIQPLQSAKKNIFVGVDTKAGYIRLRAVVKHIDPKHDIAVIQPKLPTEEQLEDTTSLKWPAEMLGDNTMLKEGRGIIVPGYPLGLGGTGKDNHPVVRFGIVAQYSEGDTFLIDGIASHGNSGSPVISVKDQKLIGMITSHVADYIALFDENKQLTAKLPYNSGLGRAIPVETLSAVIRKFNEKE